MRVLDSTVNIDIGRTQAIEQLKLRLGSAPVVQPTVVQVALGATGKSYLANLTESCTITAVISSIGQVPQQVLDTQPANRPTFSPQPESLTALDLHNSHSVSKQSVVADTMIQPIISLSDISNTNAVIAARTAQSVDTQTLPLGNILPSIQTIAQQQPMISIEHLAIASPAALTPVRLMDLVGTISEVTISQGLVNNAPNFSGIGTLINLTPISTLTSLSVQRAAEPNQTTVFDGITVSGQADAIDVFVVTTSSLNPMFSHANSSGLNTSNPQNAEANIYALEQHSIILISMQASSLAEAYPL